MAPVKRRTMGKKVYASRAEMLYAQLLKERVRKKEIRRFGEQVAFALCSRLGNEVCSYKADFLVEFPDGTCEVHEVKGHETAVWRLKEKWFREEYPGLRLKVIDAKTFKVRRG